MIADSANLPMFCLQALDAIEGTDEIALFSCLNTRRRKSWLRHAAYYGLNLLSVRNPLTRSVPVASGTKKVADSFEFDSEYEGSWQRLPRHVVERLSQGRFDVILKFGMGLLRVPPSEELPVPILSYHHGDPDRFRGRPAGFWEIWEGADVMGQVIQKIDNRLDAGSVLAFAETRVMPWSWRGTLIESYRHSPLIINQAVRNAVAGRSIPKRRNGKNYRLPDNWTVVRFTLKMITSLFRRFAYGAFFEKAWNVSVASPEAPASAVITGAFPDPGEWRTLKVARGYTFYADPFFMPDGKGLLMEGLSSATGRGEILLAEEANHRAVAKGAGHMSYPSTATVEGRQIVLPETADWANQHIYEFRDGLLEPISALNIPGNHRLVDPTLLEMAGKLYLFANILSLGCNALFLWTSDSLAATFNLHPASPIRISPLGSRMGGRIIQHTGQLYRVGQDFSGSYGDGLLAFAIHDLTPSSYAEHLVGQIRFADRKGPHTLDVQDGLIAFDWYRNRFSLLAGLRRASSLLQGR